MGADTTPVSHFTPSGLRRPSTLSAPLDTTPVSGRVSVISGEEPPDLFLPAIDTVDFDEYGNVTSHDVSPEHYEDAMRVFASMVATNPEQEN